MTGRRGGISRDVQAFQALLAPDEEEGPQQRSRQRGGGGAGRLPPRGRGDTAIPGFRLRGDSPPRRAAGPPAGVGPAAAADLAQLQEMFSGVLPADVVRDVFAACGQSLGAAADALLGMAGAPCGDVTSSAATGAAPPAATVAGAEATGGEEGEGAGKGFCGWDALPAECKLLVLGRLSLAELARAARVSTEFSEHMRSARHSMHSVAVPPGISYVALRGFVAAFGHASSLSLARWAPRLRFPPDFQAAFTAVAMGDADRLTGVRVESLSLSRCGHLTDPDVAALCATLRGLRRVDLSRCEGAGDGALAALSRYRRSAPSGADGAGGSGDDGAGGEAEEWEDEAEFERLRIGGGGARALNPRAELRRLAGEKHAAALRGQSARGQAPAAPSHLPGGGLEVLDLSATGVSGAGLLQLFGSSSAAAASLRDLDVSRCPRLTGSDLDVSSKNLRVLRANGCAGLQSVRVDRSSGLQELSLCNCQRLAAVDVDAPKLRALAVSGSKGLSSLVVTSRGLASLQASNCTSLGSLQLSVEAPALAELNLFGCSSLHDRALEALASASGGLRHLETLDLTGCTALTSVALPDASALRRVDASGCARLRTAAFGSRRLREFTAKGCAALQEVRLHCAALRTLDLENCRELQQVALLRGEAAEGAAEGVEGAAAGGGGGEVRRVVLRGCVSLPDAAQGRVRQAMAPL